MVEIKDAIYWLEIDRVVPNPYQPRREFDERALMELADSIKQYGVLQPLVVSRMESQKEDGNIEVVYELIAGERRLRASQKAGLLQVPCIIRVGDNNREKLELAIIENVVREDLNAVERAMAYQRLADEFKLTWTDIAKKVSKSREYVNNTVRILMLPQEMLEALSKGKISEGHTRPLLMLIDRPDEQITLFKEMLVRKMTVREAEKIARKIAFEKVRKKNTFVTPDVVEMENNLAEALGTRVSIDPKEKGGKIQIDYFSYDELMGLVRMFKNAGVIKTHKGMFDVIREEGLTPGSYTEDLLSARDIDQSLNVSESVMSNNVSESVISNNQPLNNTNDIVNVITKTDIVGNNVNNNQIKDNKIIDTNYNNTNIDKVINNISTVAVDKTTDILPDVSVNILPQQSVSILPDISSSNIPDTISNTLPDTFNNIDIVKNSEPNINIYNNTNINNNISNITNDIVTIANIDNMDLTPAQESKYMDDRSKEERIQENNRPEDDLYNIKDWTL